MKTLKNITFIIVIGILSVGCGITDSGQAETPNDGVEQHQPKDGAGQKIFAESNG